MSSLDYFSGIMFFFQNSSVHRPHLFGTPCGNQNNPQGTGQRWRYPGRHHLQGAKTFFETEGGGHLFSKKNYTTRFENARFHFRKINFWISKSNVMLGQVTRVCPTGFWDKFVLLVAPFWSKKYSPAYFYFLKKPSSLPLFGWRTFIFSKKYFFRKGS